MRLSTVTTANLREFAATPSGAGVLLSHMTHARGEPWCQKLIDPMIVIVGNKLRIGQTQPVRQQRHTGMKNRVAFDKNRTTLQDSDIPGDEGQRRERLVSPASEV